MNHKEELARAQKFNEQALHLHRFYKGKIQTLPKCRIQSMDDFSLWYTPGVATPCRAIAANQELVYAFTNKANSIAIVSDGTRVLGLGDIGPEAGLPVMEGKALLFKYLGGVDAVPLCLATKNPDEIIRTVKFLEPSFGGINLEDIAQPKCFQILDRLRQDSTLPVWHDDQQGSATVLLAALLNALEVTGKQLNNIRIAMIGMGAANLATYRILKTYGIDPSGIIGCDRKGILHTTRHDIEEHQAEFSDKWTVCLETNVNQVKGGIPEALQEADVCIAFAGEQIIHPDWVRRMAKNAIVFACTNPVPEIWPWEAKEAGAAIVGTGRSDFSNQINNSLVFPGVFRGTLDVQATTITDEMAIAAAQELARFARERGIREDKILPTMEEWEVYPRVAVATALKAQEQGVARCHTAKEVLHANATQIISQARQSTQLLMKEGMIPQGPSVPLTVK